MLSELFLPTKGGTAVSFDDDFRRLGGKEIHIVTADVPGAPEFDRTHPNTIHRIALERVRWLKPESLLMYSKLFLKALALSATSRFAAIFAGRVLPEGLVAWAVARLSRRPVFVYAHGEELTNWGRGRKFAVMCFVFRRADAVLANSDFTRDTLTSLLGVSPHRIHVVYPTVDETRFRPDLDGADLRAGIGLSEGQQLILSVGRLQRRKGFDNVIRALPRLGEQRIDAHYALIGIGDDRDYLERLAAEYGVSERVHLLGHVSYEDLPRWYCSLRCVRDAQSRNRRRHRGVRAGIPRGGIGRQAGRRWNCRRNGLRGRGRCHRLARRRGATGRDRAGAGSVDV